MEVTLKVRRFDPESGKAPYYQDFQVEAEPHESVLDALIRIREYEDGSLAMRCSWP